MKRELLPTSGEMLPMRSMEHFSRLYREEFSKLASMPDLQGKTAMRNSRFFERELFTIDIGITNPVHGYPLRDVSCFSLSKYSSRASKATELASLEFSVAIRFQVHAVQTSLERFANCGQRR
jgi:hypothetical protein